MFTFIKDLFKKVDYEEDDQELQERGSGLVEAGVPSGWSRRGFLIGLGGLVAAGSVARLVPATTVVEVDNLVGFERLPTGVMVTISQTNYLERRFLEDLRRISWHAADGKIGEGEIVSITYRPGIKMKRAEIVDG